jgi:hypothetical protein
VANAPIREVGGRKFAIGTLPPTRAIKVQAQIVKLAGEPVFRAFAEAKKAGAGNKEAMEAAFFAALGGIGSRLDEDVVLSMMEVLFAHCTCDGQAINIDSTFMGKLRDMWVVFFEALRVNFADLFPAGLSLSAPGTPASSASSPPT